MAYQIYSFVYGIKTPPIDNVYAIKTAWKPRHKVLSLTNVRRKKPKE
ncbi:MAG: hypothetical protein FWH41_04550 [Treponema sp.]|nr:hypothetical protein [Treponema sp.]